MKEKEIPKSTEPKTVDDKQPTETKEVPVAKELDKAVPEIKKPENCVKVNGEDIEIQPTKLKYFRNRCASIYKVLSMVPLTDFFSYSKGTFDEERDSDQIMYDFLVAVFDSEKLVHDNYDNFSSEDFERILEIFGRINHIQEKEEAARKNRAAQVTH